MADPRRAEHWRGLGAAIARSRLVTLVRQVGNAFAGGAPRTGLTRSEALPSEPGSLLRQAQAERDYQRELNGKLRDHAVILPGDWTDAVSGAVHGAYGSADGAVTAVTAVIDLIDSWKAPHPPKSEQDWWPVSRADILVQRAELAAQAAEILRWRALAHSRGIELETVRRRLADAEATARPERGGDPRG